MRVTLSPHDQELVDRGREAWSRMRQDETWEGWLAIGKAIEVGRRAIMHRLGLNRPTGRTFAQVYGDFLRENGFETIDKGVRSRLQNCLDQLPAITAWRESLGASRRLELNHPNSVWRRWQQTARPPSQKDPQTPKTNPKDAEIVRLQEELDQAQRTIAQLERELVAAKEDLARANPALAVRRSRRSKILASVHETEEGLAEASA